MSASNIRINADLRALVAQEIDQVLPEVVAFRHERHRHPELTWQEQATAKAVAQRLRQIPGLQVTEGVGRLGVVAVLKGERSGPTVGLRADMDALPVREATGKVYASCNDGVMHACGHDGHMANLLGSALVLAKLQQHLRGTVKFIFQPAEEGGAGADVMCNDGVLEHPKVDVIFGLHGWSEAPCGQVNLRTGPTLAATNVFHITVKGTGCHAALPHLGTDQVLIGARIVEGLQSVAARIMAPTEPVAVSVTKFHGGTADNVIPPQVELTGTLRTLTPQARERAMEAIKRLAEGIATANGAEALVKFESGYPPTINHDGPTAYLEEIARQVLPAGSTARMAMPTMGGEDFAYYLERVPGSFFFIGVDDGRPGGYPSLHHPAYDFNDAALPNGIKMFVHAALAYADLPS
jgi:amidohydrolase